MHFEACQIQTTMLSLRIHTNLSSTDKIKLDDALTIDFDTEDGFETLPYQILSVLASDENDLEGEDLIIVDKNGREITSLLDLADIQFTQSAEESTTITAPITSATVHTAEVWVFPKHLCDFNKYCTNSLPDTHSHPGHALDLSGCLQSSYRIIDMPYQICNRCKWFFDFSLIVSVNNSSSAESCSLQCFQCDIHKLIDIGLAPPEAADSLKTEADQFLGTHGSGIQMPIMLYLRRVLLQQAHAQIRNTPSYLKIAHSREYQDFKARVASGARTVMVYEDPAQQEAARQHIDYAKVYEYALKHLGVTELPPATPSPPVTDSSAGTTEGSTAPYVPYSKEVQELEERALLVGLMAWFKVDFFKWCNKPACDNPSCNAPPGRMDGVGTMEPTPEEKNVGGAGRTEVYKCRDCNQHTRFPRFNNPAHLLTTRRGRCGEFANAFCLICRALHLDAQYVLDFTDHVWCEVWLPSVQRFVHCDPCERALDTPLMYEQGWNKKLTHVLSFSRYGVTDSIARYSRKQNTVLTRRSAEVLLETCVAEIISAKDKELEVAYAMRRASLPPPPISAASGVANAAGELPWDIAQDGASHAACVNCLRTVGQGHVAVQALCGLDVSWVQVQERKRLQQRELLALQLSTDTTNSTYSKQGRISGDLEWKLSRGEAGDINAKDVPATAGATAAVALCSTEGPIKANAPPIAAPVWLQQVPGGQRVLFSSDPHRPTDMLLAAFNNPHLHNDANMCASPPTCYQWGNELFPKVANCGESFVCLGSSGKAVSVGTVSLEGSCHVQLSGAESLATAASAVTLTRNGVVESNVAPQYVALTYAHSLSPDSTTTIPDSAGDSAVTLTPLSNFVCSVPSQVWFPTAGSKSVEAVTAAAKEKCLTDRSLLGFTVMFVDNNTSAEVSHVLYFGQSGYPLVALNHTVTYVKTVTIVPASAAIDRNAQAVCIRRSYYHLGGACHNDTVIFDSAAFLQSLLAADGAAASCLRLSKISVWAGDSLVNGVQCTFELQNLSEPDAAPICVASSKCSSDNDNPVEHVLTLGPGDRVVSVQCRSGALIDSLEIRTLQGQMLRAGGGGGDTLSKIDIPEGQQLCGFFGGTGGHLHHVGVVLRDTLSHSNCHANAPGTVVNPISGVATSSSLYMRLLALCQQHKIAECGMLQYYDSQHGTKLFRQSNTPLLAELISNVLELNAPEIATQCLRTMITYINNIIKDPTERKYQTIKLSNAILQQSILQAHGGIALLLFGPAAFRLTVSTLNASLGQQVVQSALATEILQEDKSTSFRTRYVTWLRLYVVFLTAAVELMAR